MISVHPPKTLRLQGVVEQKFLFFLGGPQTGCHAQWPHYPFGSSTDHSKGNSIKAYWISSERVNLAPRPSKSTDCFQEDIVMQYILLLFIHSDAQPSLSNGVYQD